MSPFVRKWILKPLLILTIWFGGLAATGFIVLSTQQQRLVNLAVDEFNNQFKGKLSVGGSSISLFRYFPNISVALDNGVFFADESDGGVPVYQFDRLYVGFSPSDLLQQHYNVRVVGIRGGNLNLVREADGTINLLEGMAARQTADSIQNPSADSASAIAVDLQKIRLRDLNVSFLDKETGRKYSSHIAEVLSSFRMDSGVLSATLIGEMMLNVGTAADTTFLREKKVKVDIAADYYLDSKFFEIAHCNLKLEEAGFNVTGYATALSTTHVNLRVEGEQQDFSLVTAFLPEHVKYNLKPFQYDGRIQFDATIAGKVTGDKLPHIKVSFGCEDAWFLNTGANKTLDRVGFQGYYTNGSEQSLRTSELHVLNVSARPEKGIFKGHFAVRDFTNPKALVQIQSELELKFVGEFLGIENLRQIDGNIKLDMDFKELKDITLPEESLNRLKEGVQSKLTVQNLSFRIPGYPHTIRDLNVNAEMKDGQVTMDSASLLIGKSDIQLSGSISDVRAFLRNRDTPVTVALKAGSKQIMLADLLSYDTVLARKWKEEIQGFNVSVMLTTTANELLNPSPLPRGTFEMKNLRGTFKEYPHSFKNLSAKVEINDTLLRLRDFTGVIDSSDINFKGRVINYDLWFNEVKKGKTQIAFDFKSNRFAVRDVLGRAIRRYLPRGYRREILTNVWLRTKIDLSYDSVFRFAKAKIANVTAELKNHQLKLTEISGGWKYGSKILAFDTLRGKIGNSDFDISLKYYFKGIDRYNNKIANSLKFNSRLLDIDEMSLYDLAPKKGRSRRDTARVAANPTPDTSHAEAFNVFIIPFSDFNAQINIGKVKYNRLWLRDVDARLTMKQDQTLTVDTLMMKVARGSVRMRGKFNGSDHEKIYFRSRVTFDTVDMEKMLLKFDHFGQDLVINKNVKGRLSGTIRSYVQLHPDLVPIMSNSRAEMSIKIANGSLVDFAPMQAMATYFKDKNLRLIRFDTLENTLTFTNGVLEIPAMNINSSLGYIEVSGKQSLDTNMEYYLRVPMKMVTRAGLSSLFNGKPDEVNLEQVDEIEYIDKDRKVAFMNLKISGTPGNFKVGLGRERKKGG